MTRNEKLDLLIGYIERWMNDNSRRNLSMLSRYTGIPYPTLRRIVQKECEPSTENALYLLNFVASVNETLSYFGDDAPIRTFYRKITSGKEIVADTDIAEKLLKKESCWIIILALTLGATEENVKSLLGSHGIAELNSMIEEGFLREERPGVFRLQGSSVQKHIESLKVGVAVSKMITELPPQEDSFFRFMAYNVPMSKFIELKARCQEICEELSSSAKSSEGDTLVAGTIVLTKVLQDERKSK